MVSQSELHSASYHLLSGDLRDMHALGRRLLESGIDTRSVLYVYSSGYSVDGSRTYYTHSSCIISTCFFVGKETRVFGVSEFWVFVTLNSGGGGREGER